MVEVPLDAGVGGCKTLHGAEVENQPKHAGKDEPESASVRVFGLNAGEHVTLNVLGSTNTVDVHASVNPPYYNWNGEEKDNTSGPKTILLCLLKNLLKNWPAH